MSRRRTNRWIPGPVPSCCFSEQGSPVRDPLKTNGPSLPLWNWRKACRALDLKPIRTKPTTRSQRKAERSSKHPWRMGLRDRLPTSMNANRLLTPLLGIYNAAVCRQGLGGLTASAMPASGCLSLNGPGEKGTSRRPGRYLIVPRHVGDVL